MRWLSLYSEGYGLEARGLIPSRGRVFFCIAQNPGRFWSPTSLLSNEYHSLGQGAGQEWWSYTATPLYVFVTWWLIN
jgi:hypothetical protein